MTKPDPERLWAEADYLHCALFGRRAPDEVRRQYATVIGGSRLAEIPRCDLTTLIERRVDLEAMEAALRRRSPVNSLTQRFHALCYLVEVRPEYFDRFINERPARVTGIVTLGLQTLRALYKGVKGGLLLWIYRVG